ncbi:hypothetical protein GSS88_03240 [Corynebacterium sp. 3HC-13]|uniref:hypothetical protein n=1 Tax=Corynebacterium poyangense TaxID=2684405 RepID=UPI001CC9A3BB|nr:hypothetical protein [Corynebacterium poyangense]MBZ8176816.1 hypothetical protein [Corynebacterium poyangense]
MVDIPVIDTDPQHKHPSEGVLVNLPKLSLGLPYSEETVQDLHAAGVVYAELLLPAGSSDFPQHEGIDIRYLITGHTLSDARYALSHHGSQVVGFAIDAEPEEGVLDLLAEHWMPVSGRLEDLPHGAVQRVSCASEICDDFGANEEGITLGGRSSWIRDRRIAVLLDSSGEDLGDHPLPLLRDLGMACIPVTQAAEILPEMHGLVEGLSYDPAEFLEILSDGLDASFLSLPERSALFHQVFLPAYQELADPESEPDSDPDAASEVHANDTEVTEAPRFSHDVWHHAQHHHDDSPGDKDGGISLRMDF